MVIKRIIDFSGFVNHQCKHFWCSDDRSTLFCGPWVRLGLGIEWHSNFWQKYRSGALTYRTPSTVSTTLLLAHTYLSIWQLFSSGLLLPGVTVQFANSTTRVLMLGRSCIRDGKICPGRHWLNHAFFSLTVWQPDSNIKKIKIILNFSIQSLYWYNYGININLLVEFCE